MKRLRFDCSTVTNGIDRLMVVGKMKRLTSPSRNDGNSMAKSFLALVVSFSLVTAPVWAAPSSSLGTIVYADRARVGATPAFVGTTIFIGDRLITPKPPSVQLPP